MKYPYEDVLEQIQYLIAAVALPLVWAMGAWVVLMFLATAVAALIPSRRLQPRYEWNHPRKETGPMDTIAWAAVAAYLLSLIFGPSVTAWIRRRRAVREVARG